MIWLKKLDIVNKKALFLLVSGLLVFFTSLIWLFLKTQYFSFQKINIKVNNQNKFLIPLSPTKSPRIEIESIFHYHNPQEFIKKEDDPIDNQEIRLIATGDVIPARSVNYQSVKRQDFRYPFLKTLELLNSADILFINLESPLVPKCPTTVEGMIFCGDEKTVEGFKFAHIGVANLANNHLGNYGNEGIDNTIMLLEKNNILVTGINGKQTILTVKGKKFGFLGYNDIEKNNRLKISLADPDKIATEVALLKKDTDYVIVTFHWGIEYTSNPTPLQKELAHAAIDAGADLIIGNHPHWVQGIEIYKNKFISYAHGNFIFDQMWSQETREGVVGKYIFGSNGLQDVSYFPVIIDNYSQPRFATEKEAEKILERMDRSSKQILLDNRM